MLGLAAIGIVLAKIEKNGTERECIACCFKAESLP
jgi:hypothetical protein